MQGTVLAGSNNFFEVECTDKAVRTCSIKGKVLKSDVHYYNPLAPGDTVELEADALDANKAQITGIVPRKNAFVRWNVKGRCPQLLASNIDFILLVTSPDLPPFRPRFIDRALAQIEYLNLNPVIICNKYDLMEENEQPLTFVEERLCIWEGLGYRTLRLSAKTGEGMTELSALLENHLSVLVGQSGVGKSSLINVLDDSCVLKTGSLSKKYGRGSHTTTKGSLIRLTLNTALTGGRIGCAASIIDTPGIRRFVTHGIDAADLALYFRELKPLVGRCAFGMSCTHSGEKGCAITDAVRNGGVSRERYDSWFRIRKQMQDGSWDD